MLFTGESTYFNVFLLDLKGSVFQISCDLIGLFVFIVFFSPSVIFKGQPTKSVVTCCWVFLFVLMYIVIKFLFFPDWIIELQTKSKWHMFLDFLSICLHSFLSYWFYVCLFKIFPMTEFCIFVKVVTICSLVNIRLFWSTVSVVI